MSAPVRVQLSRRKGWRMPENTVKVTRPTAFGNPFIITARRSPGSKCDATNIAVPSLADSIECFREMWKIIEAEQPERFQQMRDSLRGKNLACWCPLPKDGEPDLCHAAILLEIANQ